MRVVTLCGSLHLCRPTLLRPAAGSERFRRRDVVVEAIDVGTEVPAFRPQVLDEAPDAVLSGRASFERIDQYDRPN